MPWQNVRSSQIMNKRTVSTSVALLVIVHMQNPKCNYSHKYRKHWPHKER